MYLPLYNQYIISIEKYHALLSNTNMSHETENFSRKKLKKTKKNKIFINR